MQTLLKERRARLRLAQERSDGDTGARAVLGRQIVPTRCQVVVTRFVGARRSGAGHIPEEDDIVFAAGGQRFAVGSEGQTVDTVAMAGELGPHLAAGDFEETNDAWLLFGDGEKPAI